MAIRYSADTEVRLHYVAADRTWSGSVRDPQHRWSGQLTPMFRPRSEPTRVETDRAAAAFIHRAERETGKKFAAKRERGRIVVTAMFEAPCPCDDIVPRARRRPR